jgi:hypothetical protein
MRLLRVRDITERDMLFGKAAARRDLRLFEAFISKVSECETIVWDWSGITIATASYLAGTCVQLFKRTLSGELDKFFVLVGLNDNCREELRLVLEAEPIVMLMADRSSGGQLVGLRPVGNLDPAYFEAFAHAAKKGKVSATMLFRLPLHGGKARIGKTAWINRLVGLYRARLLRRERTGREFVYGVPA